MRRMKQSKKDVFVEAVDTTAIAMVFAPWRRIVGGSEITRYITSE